MGDNAIGQSVFKALSAALKNAPYRAVILSDSALSVGSCNGRRVESTPQTLWGGQTTSCVSRPKRWQVHDRRSRVAMNSRRSIIHGPDARHGGITAAAMAAGGDGCGIGA